MAPKAVIPTFNLFVLKSIHCNLISSVKLRPTLGSKHSFYLEILVVIKTYISFRAFSIPCTLVALVIILYLNSYNNLLKPFFFLSLSSSPFGGSSTLYT